MEIFIGKRGLDFIGIINEAQDSQRLKQAIQSFDFFAKYITDKEKVKILDAIAYNGAASEEVVLDCISRLEFIYNETKNGLIKQQIFNTFGRIGFNHQNLLDYCIEIGEKLEQQSSSKPSHFQSLEKSRASSSNSHSGR